MPQPKKKMSNTRSGNRRSQIRLEKIMLIECKKCKFPITPHTVCRVCGFYNDQQVIDVEKKNKKSEVETVTAEHNHS